MPSSGVPLEKQNTWVCQRWKRVLLLTSWVMTGHLRSIWRVRSCCRDWSQAEVRIGMAPELEKTRTGEFTAWSAPIRTWAASLWFAMSQVAIRS